MIPRIIRYFTELTIPKKSVIHQLRGLACDEKEEDSRKHLASRTAH